VKYKALVSSVLIGTVAASLAACGAATTAEPPAAPVAQATPAPIPTIAIPTAPANAEIELGVSGSGEIMAAQDADLVFTAQGTVAEVKVKEGDAVKKGDLLAMLDTRPFDNALHQAEAALAAAKAQEAALSEAPKAADAAAARAQLQQAQAALQQVRQGPKEQDLRSADAAVALAETNLQSTRDGLSQAKTAADAGVQQAANALTQAQAAYSTAKQNWDYIQETGADPTRPKTVDDKGNQVKNKLNDVQKRQYYEIFVQAEAAMHQAEIGVQQAVVNADQARKAEIAGIQAAEQQVTQARAAAEKLRLPPDKAQVAAAQAGVAQAQAAQARILPDPSDAQKAIASSGVAQAEAGLELAKLNREHAEIRAPFDGIVAKLNIDPGDPSATGSEPAIQLVDISKLRLEVQISDVDIGRVSVGQQAKISVDSVPDKAYTGKVSYIAPTATAVGTLRTYLVRIDLDDQTGLRAGMSARVDLSTK
jgi:HlyD family secretion protein